MRQTGGCLAVAHCNVNRDVASGDHPVLSDLRLSTAVRWHRGISRGWHEIRSETTKLEETFEH
jgi:hypothetical protein